MNSELHTELTPPPIDDTWFIPNISDEPEEESFDTSFDVHEMALDDDQRAVVYHPLWQNARVVAGPGAGKTRTIICRVAKLVRDGIHPGNILLLTFTRKAAAEMLRRCREQIGDGAKSLCGGTFHSFCIKLLHSHWDAIYETRPTLIGDAVGELISMAKERACEELKIEKKGLWKSAEVYKYLSKHVNTEIPLADLLKPKSEMWLNQDYKLTVQIFEIILRHFIALKKFYNKLDYDDCLLFGVELFTLCPAIRGQWRTRFKQIIVDEHQDTNPIQHEILRLLENKNVMVVGDEHQSLYKFRGASAELFLSFEEVFGATTYILNNNYRSGQQIVDVANVTMQKSKQTTAGKHLRAVRTEPVKVVQFVAQDQYDEADWVMTQIEAARCQGVPLGDIAVLYRGSMSAIPLEMNLKKSKYPYRKAGGARFNEGVHIKDLMALLSIKAYPADRYSWERCLQILPGIGQKTAEKYTDMMISQESFDAMSPKLRAKIEPFIALLDTYSVNDFPDCVPALWTWYAVQQTRWKADELEYREIGAKYLIDYATHTPDIFRFLDEMMIDQVREPDDDSADKLTLSTIHGAKGLEWRIVFVIDVVQGRLPAFNAEDFEQELNAFYVATSRAKDVLALSYGRTARSFEGETRYTKPSEFLDGVQRITVGWEDGIGYETY